MGIRQHPTAVFCLQMVTNLDWYIFSPDSLQYVLKLENVAKAFSYVRYFFIIIYIKAYTVIVGS